jgi:S1-C subfamily serine protease
MEAQNGIKSTGKRKSSDAPASRRPTKLKKSEVTEDNSSGDELLLDGSDTSGRNGTLDSRVFPLTAGADSTEWQQTIEKVVKNVVSIRFSQTCSFDTDHASMSEATGFVVDAERGYILTNRHVVSAGPFWGYCVFDNHEECDVYPVYRDPVHDFGVLRFDPKEIKYMPVGNLELRPDLAAVGSEIRVVGNDAGEKLSILSGVISRIDRNAPEYGDGYNDFNTNYIQAAASASGGSSGSPVVNVDGYAIALQAGGSTEAATDYFLPLDRPLRALRCIQEGKPVTRGTIQTQWLIKPFDECRRLGLTGHWEAIARESNPKEIGMLVAEIILPEGPAEGFIEEGDILIKVNDELVTRFIRLEEIFDGSVGKTVKVHVQRGGQDIEFTVTVGDLHEITPDRFVTVSGASFHDLSYQQARLYAIAVKGVYVCEPSGSFRFDGADRGWIVESIDNDPTPDLQAFIKVMSQIPDRARIVMNYRHLRDLHTLHTSIVTIDRHWNSKMRLAVRNDATGLWDFKTIAEPLPPVPSQRMSANFIRMDSAEYPAAATDVVRSFVKLICTFPVKLDGFPYARKVGFGLVVDAEQGLVLVSRTIVPFDLCDIQMTFADSILVEGKVIFLHPLLNFAIVKYDPSLVDAPVTSAKLSEEHIKQGSTKIFLGYNHNSRVVVSRTTVPDVTTVAIPSNPTAPRYRAINFDAITVDTQLSTQCGCGVLLNDNGSIEGVWHTYLGQRQGNRDVEYHLGINAAALLPVVRKIQAGIIPKLRMLSAEFHTVPMSQARIMGVTEEWIQKVGAASPDRHQFFIVSKVDCGQRDQGLEESDIVLAVNGKTLTRIAELDVMYEAEEVELTIVRKCKEVTMMVPTYPTEGLETDRAVIFCGAILHKPHLAVRQSISKLHSQIYVSARVGHSPSFQELLLIYMVRHEVHQHTSMLSCRQTSLSPSMASKWLT